MQAHNACLSFGDVDSKFPSACPNAVHFWGVDAEPTAEELEAIIVEYRSRNARRFFLHLSPTLHSSAQATFLKKAGLQIFRGTGYPTLVRPPSPVTPTDLTSSLSVREIDAEDVPRFRDAICDVYEQPADKVAFLDDVGTEGARHFLAFKDDTPVAGAILYVSAGLGYLTNARTHTAHRRQGAQTLLINARLEAGLEMGCDLFCSETLYLLKTSLANLQRADFTVAYDKIVWEWRGMK